MEPNVGDWMDGCAEGYDILMFDYFSGDDEEETPSAQTEGIEETNGAP